MRWKCFSTHYVKISIVYRRTYGGNVHLYLLLGNYVFFFACKIDTTDFIMHCGLSYGQITTAVNYHWLTVILIRLTEQHPHFTFYTRNTVLNTNNHFKLCIIKLCVSIYEWDAKEPMLFSKMSMQNATHTQVLKCSIRSHCLWCSYVGHSASWCHFDDLAESVVHFNVLNNTM